MMNVRVINDGWSNWEDIVVGANEVVGTLIKGVDGWIVRFGTVGTNKCHFYEYKEQAINAAVKYAIATGKVSEV